jgi:DNA polymerase I-like protein with 3'-5' exonuclease and polymerase domains
MIVDADCAQLEWRVAAELSQDQVMIADIIANRDCHTDNATDYFGNESFRQDAKIFSFRMIYGGTAYAFFMDRKMPNFSQKKWNEIVDSFKTKYYGLTNWQDRNYDLVTQQGWLQTFTGRIYQFKPELQKDGSWIYEKPSICNYPVQGTATGDIVPLVMIQICRELKKRELFEVKPINQVHDSIVFDSPKKHVDELAEICYYYFRRLPQSIKEFWGYDWKTPMDGELKVGNDWSTMTKIKA